MQNPIIVTIFEIDLGDNQLPILGKVKNRSRETDFEDLEKCWRSPKFQTFPLPLQIPKEMLMFRKELGVKL